MTRYLFLTDRSMGFDDLLKLKKEDVFYETVMGHIFRGIVSSDPVVTNDDDGYGRQVRFKAKVRYLDIKKLKYDDEKELEFLSTEKFMHYGGSYYLSLYVWDREEQKDVELKDILNE